MKRFMGYVLLTLWALTGPVLAVDSFCSDVSCLSAAITQSNAVVTNDRIFLQAPHFVLQAPLPAIRKVNGGTLEVIGALTEPSIVERDPSVSPFTIFDARVWDGLSLSNLVIRGGNPAGVSTLMRGLTLKSVTLSDNAVGVWNSGGSVTMDAVTISSNRTGVFNHDANLIASDVIVEFNGNILSEAGVSEWRNTTFRDNAGGISVDVPDLGGELRLINSAYIHNGGGIFTGSPTTIQSTTIAFNSVPGDNAVLTCGQCRLLKIVNSTVTANTGGVSGGVRRAYTFSGAVEIQNSIVAGNSATGGLFGDCDAGGSPQSLRSLGNNLLGDCDLTPHVSDRFEDPGLAAFVESDAPGGDHFPLMQTSVAIDAANPDACPATDQLGRSRVGTCDIGAVEFGDGTSVFTVDIDVRPGSSNNNVQPNGNGSLSVAILSSGNFDAADIDPASLRFGPNQVGIESVGRLKDSNRDNLPDLIVQFRMAGTGIQCGDSSVTITGQTADGTLFQGSESIRTVGCNPNKPKKPK